jgi:hypothetical protein
LFSDGDDDGILAFASPITAAACNGIGICFLGEKNLPEAQKSFQKCLDMLEKVHGNCDHLHNHTVEIQNEKFQQITITRTSKPLLTGANVMTF